MMQEDLASRVESLTAVWSLPILVPDFDRDGKTVESLDLVSWALGTGELAIRGGSRLVCMRFVSHLATPAGPKAESIPRRKGECGPGGGQGLQNCSISRRPGLLSARYVLDPAHRAVSGRLRATPPPTSRNRQMDMARAVGTVKLGPGGYFFSCRQDFAAGRRKGDSEGRRKLIGVDVVEFL